MTSILIRNKQLSLLTYMVVFLMKKGLVHQN